MSFSEGETPAPALARAFAAQGLSASAAELATALLAGEPVVWQDADVSAGRADAAQVEGAIQDALAEVRATHQTVRIEGLRLVVPIAGGGLGRNAAYQIRRIITQPGYQAAGAVPGADSGFCSLAFDFAPSGPSPATPALSWPIRIVAPDGVREELASSGAVRRGLARLMPYGFPVESEAGPCMLAELVVFNEEGFRGPALALRFLDPGLTAHALPGRFDLADLSGMAPAVFLPLAGGVPADRLTSFLYALSHDLPVDAAAWVSLRWAGGRGRPPLVIAPREFLARAKVSDTIPLLQQRLRGFAPDRVLPMASDDLDRFGREVMQHIDPTAPLSARGLINLLGKARDFHWEHESDAGEGLLAIINAADAVERAEAPQASPPPPTRSAPPAEDRPHRSFRGTFRGPGAAPPADASLERFEAAPESFGTKSSDAGDDAAFERPREQSDGGPTKEATAPAQPASEAAKGPARYTDIQIFDPQNKLQDDNAPLLAGQPYVLDVAISVERKGYTKDRSDQPAVVIPRQTETADCWVVVTDESDTEDDEAKLFAFDRHFDKFRLPVSGDSERSVQFRFTPSAKVLRRDPGIQPRLGIRLYHKLNLIDHIELELRVDLRAGAATAGADKAIKVLFKHPSGAGAVEAPDTASAGRALNISISKPGEDGADQGLYRFSFVAGKSDSGEPALFGTKKLSESALNDFVAKFRDILLDTVFGPSLVKLALKADERDELLKSLSLLGTRIVTELFDYGGGGDFFQLGEMVRGTLAETSIIQISLSKGAQDFVFPWQILTVDHYTDRDKPVDPKNLWGYRFIVEVKRCGDGADTRAPTARAPTPTRVTYARWQKFSNEKDHYARLQELIKAAKAPTRLLEPVIDTKDDFFAALGRGGGELFYVYAHGHSAAPGTPAGVRFRDKARQQIEELARKIEAEKLLSTAGYERQIEALKQFKTVTSEGIDSLLTLSLSEITLTSLRVQMPPGGPRLADAPVVFLNTCESAQMWNAVEGSFVGFFLDRGARAVLGSETTIPIVLADAFSRVVLEAMFAGNTLGEAVHKARWMLLKDSKNPLGLCYSIYGAADARIVPVA
jgi:hypothetical protein